MSESQASSPSSSSRRVTRSKSGSTVRLDDPAVPSSGSTTPRLGSITRSSPGKGSQRGSVRMSPTPPKSEKLKPKPASKASTPASQAGDDDMIAFRRLTLKGKLEKLFSMHATNPERSLRFIENCVGLTCNLHEQMELRRLLMEKIQLEWNRIHLLTGAFPPSSSETESLEETKERLNKINQERREEVMSLEKKIDQKKQEIGLKQEAYNELLKKQIALNEAHLKVVDETGRCEVQLRRKEEELHHREEEVAELERELTEVKDKIVQVKKYLEDHTLALDEEEPRASKELNEAEERVESLQKKTAQLKQVEEALRTKIKEQEKTIESLRKDLEVREKNVKETKDELIRLRRLEQETNERLHSMRVAFAKAASGFPKKSEDSPQVVESRRRYDRIVAAAESSAKLPHHSLPESAKRHSVPLSSMEPEVKKSKIGLVDLQGALLTLENKPEVRDIHGYLGVKTTTIMAPAPNFRTIDRKWNDSQPNVLIISDQQLMGMQFGEDGDCFFGKLPRDNIHGRFEPFEGHVLQFQHLFREGGVRIFQYTIHSLAIFMENEGTGRLVSPGFLDRARFDLGFPSDRDFHGILFIGGGNDAYNATKSGFRHRFEDQFGFDVMCGQDFVQQIYEKIEMFAIEEKIPVAFLGTGPISNEKITERANPFDAYVGNIPNGQLAFEINLGAEDQGQLHFKGDSKKRMVSYDPLPVFPAKAFLSSSQGKEEFRRPLHIRAEEVLAREVFNRLIRFVRAQFSQFTELRQFACAGQVPRYEERIGKSPADPSHEHYEGGEWKACVTMGSSDSIVLHGSSNYNFPKFSCLFRRLSFVDSLKLYQAGPWFRREGKTEEKKEKTKQKDPIIEEPPSPPPSRG